VEVEQIFLIKIKSLFTAINILKLKTIVKIEHL